MTAFVNVTARSSPAAADELDRLVHGRVDGDLRVGELVRAEPQRRPHRRVELGDRAAAELLDPVVERADALDRPVGEPLRERPLARVDALDRAAKGTVGVGVVLEDAPHVSKAARRAGETLIAARAGTPRSPSACRPSGCTSTGTSSPPSTRARQTVTGRPCSSPRAPMCGESARIRFSSSCGGRLQSSSRSSGRIFSA